jgi:hypothetical protein
MLGYSWRFRESHVAKDSADAGILDFEDPLEPLV